MRRFTAKGIVFNWLETFDGRVIYRSECGNIDLSTYFTFRNEQRWRAEVVGLAFAGINEPCIDEATPEEALDILRRRLVVMDESTYREAAERHIAARKALIKEST